jgi:competence protein ComEA
VPETESPPAPGALAPDRRAALGLPPVVAPPTWRQRAEGLAAALGTTPVRLAAGAAVAVVVAAALAWTLFASPGPGSTSGSGGAGGAARRAAALPVASHTPTTAAPSADPAEVVVDAAGAVARPGVYQVPARSRVADVLAAAGGPGPDADLDQVNLAAPVADGDRVYIPRKGERPPDASAAAGAPGAQPLDLNQATVDQLDALPGVGPSTARAIVAWRTEHGPFRRVDDLLEVRGIGPAKLDALRSEVRV